MKRLLEFSIEPAKDGEVALTDQEIDELIAELGHDWNCIDHHELEKEFTFEDFMSALAFVNTVGEFAEKVDHHPEITFTWGRAKVSIYTHDVDGLREADFAWAANVQNLYDTMTR